MLLPDAQRPDSHAFERGGELVRGVEAAGTTGQLIRVSGNGWEAIRGVYVPPLWGLILCLNALKRGFVDELAAHKRYLCKAIISIDTER